MVAIFKAMVALVEQVVQPQLLLVVALPQVQLVVTVVLVEVVLEAAMVVTADRPSPPVAPDQLPWVVKVVPAGYLVFWED